MSLGSLTRRVLGRRLFARIGPAYRAVFVDLSKVVDSMPDLGGCRRVLDIGGGDGEVINLLLERHPHLEATMIDLAQNLAAAVKPHVRNRVRVLPRTSVRAYAALGEPRPDLVILSDVLHHVPVPLRPQLLADVRDLLEAWPALLVIKDVEPGSWRARLGYLADRYVSGDRQVELQPRAELVDLVRRVFDGASVEESPLMTVDRPNYSICVRIPANRSV